MIDYLLMLLFLIQIISLSYTSFYLILKPKSSVLYQGVGLLGIIGLAISLINFIDYLNSMFDVFEIASNFYSQILFVLFVYTLFKIWEIRYNQFTKQNYKLFIIVLNFINFGLILNSQFNFIVIASNEITMVLPLIINIMLLILVYYLFYDYNRQAANTEFKIFPLTILILILLKISFAFINFSLFNPLFYYLFLLSEGLCFLIMSIMSIGDFKQSFYY